MTPILLLEAFGELPPTAWIETERDRERRERESPPTGVSVVGLLHRVFDARAELMGWSTTSPAPPQRNLWDMCEAGLTANGTDPSLIGWVYVGLANPTDLNAVDDVVIPEGVPDRTGYAGWATIRMPPEYGEATVGLSSALPPLVQCFDDALRRIGATEVSGFQVTCYGACLGPRSRFPGHLASGLSWFGATEQAGPRALVSFDEGFLGGHSAVELASNVRRRNTGAFEFGDVVSVPEPHKVRMPAGTPRPDIPLEPSGVGVSVVLPEWTASAVGWTLATVVDVARVMAPEIENFAVRIAQVE
ncbi:MAG: hypothetical protein OXF79_19330 [Chloroflexi bacterium]|nr:hypothetical protein [Chloroflexota bacterium]